MQISFASTTCMTPQRWWNHRRADFSFYQVKLARHPNDGGTIVVMKGSNIKKIIINLPSNNRDIN